VRILYVAQRVPFPPNRGDKLAAYHAVRHLARKHTVTVAALADSDDELGHARRLAQEGMEVLAARLPRGASRAGALRALLTGEALSVGFFRSRELRARIAARARSTGFDVAVAFSSSTGPYVTALGGTPIVADFVDLDSRKWDLYSRSRGWPLSWLYALEARRLLAYERELAGRAFRTLVRTEAEREDCVRLIPAGRFEVLANGVDLEYFTPREDADPNGAASLVFTGVMDYYPNVQAVTYFCDAVLPRIQERLPHTTFTIVGARPTSEVQALARRRGVRVTGQVPDVRPFVREASLAVAPLLLARGVQNKVLEAMAMAVPVVASPMAFRGVGAPDGEGVLVADTPAQFAEKALCLLLDPAGARQLGDRGRRFVEQNCVWEKNLLRLEQILEQAAR
jgi:sugar transferase (PEP-CTERM/EpsH1 system associated)